MNTYLKFRLIADYTNYIVGIAEHDRGGFLVEQGYFTALDRYFAKTHVFKRDYHRLNSNEFDMNIDSNDPYSGMQTAIFDLLEEAGRLCEWTTEDDLIKCVGTLP